MNETYRGKPGRSEVNFMKKNKTVSKDQVRNAVLKVRGTLLKGTGWRKDKAFNSIEWEIEQAFTKLLESKGFSVIF